jgi:peroxiredoxin
MYIVKAALVALIMMTASCGGMTDDLAPSGSDNRQAAQTGSEGGSAGQMAPDFTVTDSMGRSVNLYSELGSNDGVVLYFTMWCPVCSSHTDHMLANIVPLFPNVKFFLVDYVSGSVTAARDAQVSNGYSTAPVVVLVDSGGALLSEFGGTMGTTIVITKAGEVTLNEDYRDGSALKSALESL